MSCTKICHGGSQKLVASLVIIFLQKWTEWKMSLTKVILLFIHDICFWCCVSAQHSRDCFVVVVVVCRFHKKVMEMALDSTIPIQFHKKSLCKSFKRPSKSEQVYASLCKSLQVFANSIFLNNFNHTNLLLEKSIYKVYKVTWVFEQVDLSILFTH